MRFEKEVVMIAIVKLLLFVMGIFMISLLLSSLDSMSSSCEGLIQSQSEAINLGPSASVCDDDAQTSCRKDDDNGLAMGC